MNKFTHIQIFLLGTIPINSMGIYMLETIKAISLDIASKLILIIPIITIAIIALIHVQQMPSDKPKPVNTSKKEKQS